MLACSLVLEVELFASLRLTVQIKGQIASILKTHKGSLLIQKYLERMGGAVPRAAAETKKPQQQIDGQPQQPQSQSPDAGLSGAAAQAVMSEQELALFHALYQEVCEDLPLLMMNRFAQYAIGQRRAERW